MNNHSSTISDINNQESTSPESQLQNAGEETHSNHRNQDHEGDENNSIQSSNNSIDDNATSASRMTEINISPTPQSSPFNYHRGFFLNDNPAAGHRLWTNEERDAYQERRREALSSELNRVQRTSFVHFLILCLVPIALIGLVLLSSFRGDDGCEGYGSVVCQREMRDFRNAFRNKCVCTAFQAEG